MPYFYFPTDTYYWVLVVPTLLIAMWAQGKVSSTFNRYSRVMSQRGLTGREAAQRILAQNGVTGVQFEHVSGNMTDHYDPRTNTIRLSDTVDGSRSVAAIGVACHEAGHAVQYASSYAPIKLRNAFLPVANIGSKLWIPIFLIGLLLGGQYGFLVNVGLLLFGAVALFQLLTLPVEFNASRRAVAALESGNLLHDEELEGAKKVLSAAAMTYVAALLTTVAQLLRMVLIFGSRGNNSRNNRG